MSNFFNYAEMKYMNIDLRLLFYSQVCKNDTQCLLDVAATKNIKVGQATVSSREQFTEKEAAVSKYLITIVLVVC